jgi:hypothetical protein
MSYQANVGSTSSAGRLVRNSHECRARRRLSRAAPEPQSDPTLSAKDPVMMTRSNASSASIGAALALLLAALPACTTADAEGSVSARVPEDPAGLAAKVQQLADLDAIRAVPACYGLGHDLIFRHLGGDHRDALEALRRCHRDALITNVYLFDETRPAAHLTSLAGLIGFIENFALQQGYSSARNVPGNVRVEVLGPSSARVLSSTAAPHFLTHGASTGAPGGTDRPTLDLVSARYVDLVQRDPDGVWRVVQTDLFIEQIWRGEGAYPFATP